MIEQPHQRRIEAWLRIGIAVVVPLTVVIGLWLLLGKRESHVPPPPTDGSAHVVAFPASAGPPQVTLAPAAAPQTDAKSSTP